MTKKVVMVGRPGVGKTSIKMAIFQGKSPKDLMFNSLEPTRGIETSVYSWMDVELSLFDSSGQELEQLLDSIEERKILFDNTDSLIYVVDYIYWVTQPKLIIEEIQRIARILKGFSSQTKLIIFFHKVDLINRKITGNFNVIRSDLLKYISSDKIDIFFTSLYPKLIFKTFNALSSILSGYSKEAAQLKKVADDVIKDLPKSICFITNRNHNIVIHSMTNDFDISIMEFLYEKIDSLSKSNKYSLVIDNDPYIIDSGSKLLNVIVDNIENINPNFKKIIILSENLGKGKVFQLLQNFKKKSIVFGG